jgi:hypothetical protein
LGDVEHREHFHGSLAVRPYVDLRPNGFRPNDAVTFSLLEETYFAI